MRTVMLQTLLLLTALGTQVAGAQTNRTDHPAEALLTRLEGQWRMRGHVRGEPVEYTLTATRTLAARYLELHMLDVATPPAYEARVFIGSDTTPPHILVHWLDSFGAAFSVPHGSGRVSGDTLQFTIRYSTGPFRDIIVFDRARDTWTLSIEAGDPEGRWSPFAAYEVRRATAR